MELLDANRDDEISLSELKVVFEPLMKKNDLALIKDSKIETFEDKLQKDSLMRSVSTALISNRQQLERLFRSYRIKGNPSFVEYDQFKEVLRVYNQQAKLGLTRQEIENMCNTLTEITHQGWVNYTKFLDQFAGQGKLSATQLRQIQKSKEKEIKENVERIRKHIKEGIKGANITYKEAFDKFDLDNSKKVDFSEFK